ncbi:glycoside hydrolase family 88 protein [Terrisporobacter glycolicus]|nr:glycoside hydrolase family 88 protein [Terrisporobacter glycolicus]
MFFILSVLILIILVITIIDIIPIFYAWLSRVHIGRYTNNEVWKNDINQIGKKWLNNTPKIKVTDNTRLVAIDMIKGNYTKSAIQNWQEAALLLGLGEEVKGNHSLAKSEIEKFLNDNFNSDGSWKKENKHVDSAILAYAVMKLEYIDTNKYKESFDRTYELIKDNIGQDGTVQYRKFMSNYRYVDTIGFICPFLTSYGLKYNNQESIRLAIKQIEEYNRYGLINNSNIPFHAYSIDNKDPLGLYGWGRGLGWYAIGLIDSYCELPNNNIYKKQLEEYVIKLAKTVIKYQQDNGSWNWTVSRKESRADSSATATLCWFLLNSSSIDIISMECKESYEKGIQYLMSVTRRNGVVDFSQGDTKDIGVYSQLFDKLPFTQGFCIRCSNKIVKK